MVAFFAPTPILSLPLSLAYKGRGFKAIDGTATNLVLNYSSVSDGSAPAAGDVVVWYFHSTLWFGTGYTVNSLSSPWVQAGPSTTSPGASQYGMAGILMNAGNLSSPPTWITVPSVGAYLFATWFAFSVTGPPPTVAMGTIAGSGVSANAPASVTADSSALNPPAVAITVSHRDGDDGTISPFTGVTMDSSQQENNILNSTIDCLWGHKLDIGGAVNTFTGVDNGGGNGSWCGYVSCS